MIKIWIVIFLVLNHKLYAFKSKVCTINQYALKPSTFQSNYIVYLYVLLVGDYEKYSFFSYLDDYMVICYKVVLLTMVTSNELTISPSG